MATWNRKVPPPTTAFPLTIAAPLDPKINVLSVFNVAGDWFERVEQLARSALDDDFDLDRFGNDISQLALPDGLLAPGNGGDPPTTDTLDRLLYSYSFWWTLGSTRVLPSYLLCQGLPPPQGFAAMLDGNWQKWGWDDRQFLVPHQTMDPTSNENG